MSPMKIVAVAVAVAVALSGCSSGAGDSVDSSAANVTKPTIEKCPRPLAPANRTRKAVVSHPFGDRPNRYEVLSLTAGGTLARSGVEFEMGRASSAVPIVFTPDGKIGLAVQEGGTVGVFRVTSSGGVEVIDAGWYGGFHAGGLTMDPTGSRVFAVDQNTAEHGGGLYELAIGCDGRLSSRGLVVPGGRGQAFTFIPGVPTRGVYFAARAFDSAPTSNTFLLDVSAAAPTLVAQGDGFGDALAIVSSIGITADGKYALVGDGGIGAGNRVAVVSLASMKQRQLLETAFPYSIATSPWNNAAIVVNGDSADEITTLGYAAANEETPFSITGTIPSNLPGVAVSVTRGARSGRVLVAELSSVRQLQFTEDGHVDDVDRLHFPATIDDIVGTIGIEP